jgi:glutamine amidotransferase
MKINVGIIDYKMGNLLSLSRAFMHLNANPVIIEKPDDIKLVDILVLPGVGAFPDGMKMINENHFPDAINDFIKTGKNFMGICLGMQMMLSKGYEHKETSGLGLIEGSVRPLPNDTELKVPNINWHDISKSEFISWNHSILKNTKEGSNFYFVHSFYAEPEFKENILAETHFGPIKFASAVKKDNVFGTQFHPEKSGNKGLRILETLLTL